MSNKPTLIRLPEFESSLDHYRMNEDAIRALAQASLVLMVAPSSSGRNTIIKELAKGGNYHFVISDTTRPPRTNDGVMERDGVEYHFKTEAEMLDQIKNGEMVEAAIIHRQQVSGISIREIKKAHDLAKISIADVEPVGAANIKKRKDDTICIFVLPPSFEEWQRRMTTRGAMTDEERRRRLESACKEFKTALREKYYFFVINDELENVVNQVDKIARFGITDEAAQRQALELLQGLLDQTEAFLAQH